MPTTNDHRHIPPAAAAAIERFVDCAWRSQGSLFTPGQDVWTAANLDDLHRRFVQQPDESKATFLEKFRKQLVGAPALTWQLAAELLYVHSLTPFKMRAQVKVELVDAIRLASPAPAPFPDDLRRALDRGFVSDQSFFHQRPSHLWYLIDILRKWNTLPQAERTRLLGDPWSFKTFAQSVEVRACQPMREILYFFVHPTFFEAITSRKHKAAIAKHFRSRVADPAADVDQLLHQVRGILSPEHGTDFNFYAPQIKPLWRGQSPDESEDDAWSVFLEWAQRIRATAGFESFEIEYKQQIARNIREAVSALNANDAAFLAKLRKAFGPPNNLTAWQTHDRFLRWCEQDPETAAEALKILWGGGEVRDRISRFLERVPNEAGKGAGVRTAIAAFLLMGGDPAAFPMYRRQAFQAAFRLAGHAPFPSSATSADQYGHAVAFLDKLVAASSGNEVPIANRLEAQGVVWAMTKWESRPDDWSEEEWKDLEEFRGGAKPDSDEADEEPEGPENDKLAATTLEVLADDLLLDVRFLRDIKSLLADKRQVIFYGPPGTGKTYVAQRLAECLAGSPTRVSLVQFHPSYSYEDFIEGFRPAVVNGAPGFQLSEGPLKAIARKASAAPSEQFVLVIDELNRGNLAKVFGELYFLLEYRGSSIRLQYSAAEFRLPENLWIIGTMNSTDRTIAILDAALRRRFYFVEFFPDRAPIEGLLRRWLRHHKPEMSWVADVVDLANRELSDRHMAIGPSHFMKTNLNQEWLEKIWRHAVIPYVEEHFFGEPDRVRGFDLASLQNRLPTSE